jgi:DNA-binding Lrp family transcriptional regulator
MHDYTYKILFILNKHIMISQREIASMVGFSVGTVNSVLKRLEELDYIKVEKSPNHRK